MSLSAEDIYSRESCCQLHVLSTYSAVWSVTLRLTFRRPFEKRIDDPTHFERREQSKLTKSVPRMGASEANHTLQQDGVGL